MKTLKKWLSITVAIAMFATLVVIVSQLGNGPVKVKLPELSAFAKRGKVEFDSRCAACHGNNGAGTKQGPPLIHKTYNPGHHNNDAFYRAVKNGVAKHHWNFGNMPPIADVSKSQVSRIIRYVRELQLANGIVTQKHNM